MLHVIGLIIKIMVVLTLLAYFIATGSVCATGSWRDNNKNVKKSIVGFLTGWYIVFFTFGPPLAHALVLWIASSDNRTLKHHLYYLGLTAKQKEA